MQNSKIIIKFATWHKILNKKSNMERENYDRLIDEVFSLINKDELSEAIKSKRSSIRVDGVQDLIRTAIIESSISRHKGLLYFFNGKIYEPLSYDEFSNLIYDLMKRCGLPLGDYSRFHSVIELCLRATSNKQLKIEQELVVFNDCVLDTRRMIKHKFDKSLVQLSSVGYKYDDMAIAPQWNIFLEVILPNRKDRTLLQEALGCLLLNRSKTEYSVFLSGAGTISKEIIFDTMKSLFGEGSIGEIPVGLLLTGAGRKKNIALIDGLRANFSRDTVSSDITRNEDSFKSLISGEPLEAKQPLGESFMAKDVPVQFISVMEMPVLQSMNDSLRNKILIIEFKDDTTIERNSKQLSGIFKDEYSGIFNWVLEGKNRYIKNGYDFSDRSYIETKIEEHQGIGNSVLKFMYVNKYYKKNKNITDTIPRWINSIHLYNSYKKWCLDNEITPETMNNFGGILRKDGYQKRHGTNGNQYAIYGTTIKENVHSETVILRKKRANEDNLIPYMIDGREYINTQAGISKQTGVSTSQISIYRKAGLLTDCYHMDGYTLVFDIAKTKMRLKQIGKYMTEEQTEAIKQKMKEEAKKRGLFNAEMKKNNSKARIYKSPEDEMLIKIRNSIQREERKLLSQEVKKLEKQYDKLRTKTQNSK